MFQEMLYRSIIGEEGTIHTYHKKASPRLKGEEAGGKTLSGMEKKTLGLFFPSKSRKSPLFFCRRVYEERESGGERLEERDDEDEN